MAEDQKDRYIQYLVEQNQEHLLTEKAMPLVLEDFVAQQKLLEDRMAAFEAQQTEKMEQQQKLKEQLSDERKMRKSAERKAKTLQEQLDYAKQERFRDRRQRVRLKPEPDREDEKDGFDGTEDTLRTDSVDNAPLEMPS